jgi:NADP-dependent 3-hydroxy acid dehydrogenase YdfG
MNYYGYLNPVKIYEGVRDGTLCDLVDKRILSAMVALVGIKIAKTLAFDPLYNFYRYNIRPGNDLFTRYGGGWAVVTGAQRGIGLGYCKRFAELGFNVFMISKDEDELEKAAKIVQEYGPKVKIRTLAFDLNRAHSAKSYKPVYAGLDEIKDVSILVHNVGYDPKEYKEFHEFTPELMTSIYQLNSTPMIFLTHHCLKLMVARKKKGGIINVSSLCTLFNAYES